MKVRLIRLSYFIWIIVPLVAFLTYQAFGLPHIIWSYSFRDNGQGYDPFAERWYTRCTFIGPYGEHTKYPQDGSCAWVRFFTNDGGA